VIIGYITPLYCRYGLLIYVLIVNTYSYITQIFALGRILNPFILLPKTNEDRSLTMP
jgi:hypothetical protein